KNERVVAGALSALEPRTAEGRAAPAAPRFARLPLEPLLLSIVAGPPNGPGGVPPPDAFSPETRLSALKALLLEPAPHAEPLLARLAFDGGEDDFLRHDAAYALVTRAGPA